MKVYRINHLRFVTEAESGNYRDGDVYNEVEVYEGDCSFEEYPRSLTDLADNLRCMRRIVKELMKQHNVANCTVELFEYEFDEYEKDCIVNMKGDSVIEWLDDYDPLKPFKHLASFEAVKVNDYIEYTESVKEYKNKS